MTDLSSIETMRAYLKARAPSETLAMEQILVDLGVHDGMEIRAADVEQVVTRVSAKLTGRTGDVDYSDPIVSVEPATVAGRSGFKLRISATRKA